MAATKRRELLRALGVLGGGALVGGGVRSIGVVGAESAGQSGAPNALANEPWKYRKLDPAATAERAYRLYPDGSCMYAIVGSVVTALAEMEGEPYRSFPLTMMRYGEGGLGSWGSVCGVVNGAGALIGLFHGTKRKEEREALVAQFCTWYETTALPRFRPSGPEGATEVPTSVAHSVLCHLSVSHWCEASGKGAFSPVKSQRCRRMTADGAARIVEILNRAQDELSSAVALTPAVARCTACHGRRGRGDAIGQMDCAPCHKMPDPHP